MVATNTYSLDLQGHRGARGLRPENTLPAFARALSLGVTTLELDCAITKDGVVVVSHDSTLNPDITRAAGGRWLTGGEPPIRQFTYEELRRLDVGRINPESAYSKRFPEQQPADGARMPRLADVFALARKAGNDAVRFNIETKISPLHSERTVPPDSFAQALIRLIIKENIGSRVTIQSFDWRTLAIVQKEAPEIPTVYLTVEKGFMDSIQRDKPSSPWTAGFHVSRHGGSIPRMVKAAGGAVQSPYYAETAREQVKEAQALGLKVVVWTVNEPADLRRLIEWRVDGIISDYPDRLRQVAGEMGVPLPRPTPVEP
ncbi:MAG: glycerophosphodiester phosphodiesterase [Betaproteobacteria bacterium]|nr:glycerophosphodiester phosphodiesterase [Betaproteobacteria bacterium]